ncbi:CAP Gly-rich domain-containing protein [Syncephalastrum racemosum]|uniref:CAP Gly-rich domain-containing protein n=1 Tax=Syncephalastrum racemosum TaxID=13706 RepID=A0A1X2HBY8_SYNRA|nr:CAP Gly-rich domain-containing protein [Syncephalastrum racemosum]
MSDDKAEEEEEDDGKAKELKIGDMVKLIHRPLPTLGHVRYIGPVAWAEGDDWVGVELQSRVGKNDGSVDGKRYFQTDPHRGIFVTKSELTLA